MKTALLDVGNSTVQLALYDGHTIGDSHTWPTTDFQPEHPLFQNVSSCVISSVVPHLDPILNTLPNPTFVTAENIPDIRLNVPNPEQVGADRLVAAYAVHTLYPGPAIIIDSGTVITFCQVDADGSYQGGAFFPGMGISSKALHDYTAKIPLIYVAPQDKIIGKNTQEAVEIGLYHGYLEMMKGMIRKYRESIPGVAVVGTGTWVDIFRKQLDLDAFDEQLIVKGLALIADQ